MSREVLKIIKENINANSDLVHVFFKSKYAIKITSTTIKKCHSNHSSFVDYSIYIPIGSLVSHEIPVILSNRTRLDGQYHGPGDDRQRVYECVCVWWGGGNRKSVNVYIICKKLCGISQAVNSYTFIYICENENVNGEFA